VAAVKLAVGGGLAALVILTVLTAAILAGIVSWFVPTPASDTHSAAGLVGPVADIPPGYLALYTTAAASCPGLGWSVLAAVGKVETDHGRSPLPGVHSGTNNAGAAGPMQFLQPTFEAVVVRHPLPPGGATPPSRYNAQDAVFAAAAYLCDNGARGDTNIARALYQYNHSAAYVSEVLRQARAYTASVNPTAAPVPGAPERTAERADGQGPPDPGRDPVVSVTPDGRRRPRPHGLGAGYRLRAGGPRRARPVQHRDGHHPLSDIGPSGRFGVDSAHTTGPGRVHSLTVTPSPSTTGHRGGPAPRGTTPRE
jgi:hypothetical protein